MSQLGQPRHVGPTTLSKKVREIAEFAGLDLHPHVLRHTACTRLLEQTGDVILAQRFMGHADPKTTAIYAKVRNPRLERAVAKLDFGR